VLTTKVLQKVHTANCDSNIPDVGDCLNYWKL